MSDNLLTIDYYSDILCVWAWIAQRRIDELNAQLGDKIKLRYHYVDVFGSTESKIASQWAERGHYSGFAQHVQESAAAFKEVTLNPSLWLNTRPTTSANAHLTLKAVELAYNAETSIDFALYIRKAFFIDARDIADLGVLAELANKANLDSNRLEQVVNNGSAMAALMSDYQKAKQLSIKGSPSYVMDNGRQTLYGNVGYRVLHANIEELLKHPADEASWC